MISSGMGKCLGWVVTIHEAGALAGGNQAAQFIGHRFGEVEVQAFFNGAGHGGILLHYGFAL